MTNSFADLPADRAARFAIEEAGARPQAYAGMPVLPDEVAHSIAISLKRIADRIDHLTDYFEFEKAQLRVVANCNVRSA